ncbi:potassium voltage-gated channel protein egl-36-like [Haliotis rufescens]|uniref:potassium voltage-gated channel protein egl-36-like n=1 Tax=Haliotis rufescens TaxID=6454 RepID=UPI001EAFD248|nr:potassium voltage-gated channel protein egl-36-like [Haliotis rufescens]
MTESRSAGKAGGKSEPAPSIVKFNIGGKKFETLSLTLKKFPGTRLASLHPQADEYNRDTGEYFFDRDPIAFGCILNLYRTSSLHFPDHLCGNYLREELNFWRIPESLVSECCWTVFFNAEQDNQIFRNLKKTFSFLDKDPRLNETGKGGMELWMHRIWLLLDKPNSSRAAKIWSTFYMFLVFISVSLFCAQSHPTFRVARADVSHTMRNITNPKIRMYHETNMRPELYWLDVACVVVFTVEILLYLLCVPDKGRFYKSFTNVINFILVLVAWAAFAMEMTMGDELLDGKGVTYWTYGTLKLLLVLRILRFFRLSQRYSSLNVIVLAMKASLNELILMVMSFFLTATIYGCVIYVVEIHSNSFHDIPVSIWWAIVTMTTVGYGDFYPLSGLGRTIGTFCAICGLVVLSMPIAIIAANFNNFQSRNEERQQRRRGNQNTPLKKIGWMANVPIIHQYTSNPMDPNSLSTKAKIKMITTKPQNRNN